MEEIVLLDEITLRPIGSAPKLASHNSDTPLHLAFSCFVFNQKGEYLLTQRAHIKKVWPGVWTGSFCGHPLPDEAMEDAILRRAQFELGITQLDNLKEVIPDYRYITPPFNGIIENELCPVYFAEIYGQPLPNPDEVEHYQWVSLPALYEDIEANPQIYSYWFKDQLDELKKRSILR